MGQAVAHRKEVKRAKSPAPASRRVDHRDRGRGRPATSRARYQVAWEPQPGPQTALLSCPVYEVFYGGARGGGKTDGMLGDFAAHAATYGADASGVFFRREFKQLEDVIKRSHRIYKPLGATYNKSTATWSFPNGAQLKFRHLWDIEDAEAYQGHAYTWICFEELTNWPVPDAINRLRGTLRSAAGVPVYFRATGNPGGPGHNWVKSRYIEPGRNGFKILRDPQTGLDRVFIPARLEDNQILTANDPNYEAQLFAIGNEALSKAWRYGEWDIVAGGFFDDVFNARKHIIKPFAIPSYWKMRRSFDWGSAKPASLGLWAVSEGYETPTGLFLPRGSFIRVGEWYTVAKAPDGTLAANVGLRLSNETLGAGIAELSDGRQWRGCVADPSIFSEQGGPSIYAQMKAGALREGHNLLFNKADNERVAGWARMRTMLKAVIDGDPESPQLLVFDTCSDWIRTVPTMMRDEKALDDIDTDQEDHAADETRYAVMSTAKTARVTSMFGGR